MPVAGYSHMPELNPYPSEEASDPAGRNAGAWVIGVVAFLALIAAAIISVGLASIVWVPLVLGIGIAMVGVWTSRRKRQTMQGRDANEVKDPTHAHPRWPSNVIDDRLPEP
jgi:hypothetical protein